jgi:ribonuclease III
MSEQPEIRVDDIDDGDSQPVSNHGARDGNTTQPVLNHGASDGNTTQSSEGPVTPTSLSETFSCLESDTDLKHDLVSASSSECSGPQEDTPESGASVESDEGSTESGACSVEPEAQAQDALSAPVTASNPRSKTIRFTEELLAECEHTIGYKFSNRAILEQSLTHASISKTRLASNERLEFLGDSIMGAVVCEYLFQEFPEYPEGELTRIKSSVVSRHTCSKISAQLNFGRFLALGKGLAVHDRIPTSILAAAFESVIAAVYLDGGWDPARHFIVNALREEVKRVSRSAHGFNFKSMLQQSAQKTMGATPIYKLLGEKGPDHSKNFQISASISDRLFPPAWGASKKEAEQNAAKNALDELKAKKAPAPVYDPSQVAAQDDSSDSA